MDEFGRVGLAGGDGSVCKDAEVGTCGRTARNKESWLSGRKHLTANEAIGNDSGVRISHSPQMVSRMAREKPIGKTGINDVKEDASVVGHKVSGS